MSHDELIQLGTALAVIIAAVIQQLDARRVKRGIAQVHDLVNSGALVQYKLNAELSRWKADQTKDSVHIQAADEAEKLYLEHAAKQLRVDSLK